MTITVNGKLKWSGTDPDHADAQLAHALKAYPTAVIEVSDGDQKLVYHPAQSRGESRITA